MTDVEENPTTESTELPDEVAAMFDLSLKKKKKKKKTEESVKDDSNNTSTNVDSVPSSSTVNHYGIELDPPTYEYTVLLDRIIDFLHSKDPAWAEKRRQTLKAPQLSRG